MRVHATIVSVTLSITKTRSFLLLLMSPAAVVAVKHGRSGFPKVSVLIVDEIQRQIHWGQTKKKSIGFEEIEAIVAGKVTRVLQGVTARSALSSCCLSIIAKRRTLDLELESPEQRDRVLFMLQKKVFVSSPTERGGLVEGEVLCHSPSFPLDLGSSTLAGVERSLEDKACLLQDQDDFQVVLED